MGRKLGFQVTASFFASVALLAGCNGAPPQAETTASNEAPIAVAPSPKAQAVLDDLRARFKLRVEEPTSSTDETPVTRTYEALLASDADRVDALSTSLAPHLASPAKGTAKTPNLALPKTATGAARVSEAASGLYVDVQPAGLAAAAAEVADGYVVYASARSPKEHLLRRITADGVEDFENFELAPASPDVSYDLGLSPKVAGLRLVGNSLELLDATGTPRLRVPSPYLVDATGARIDATLAVQGCAVDTSPAAPWGRAVTVPGAAHCTLKVSWDGSKVTYPALLDPSWTTTGSMPNTQADHKGVLLAGGKTLVIGPNFGNGCFLYDPPSGTWSTTGSPVKQRSNAMVAVLQDGRVLLAGGYNGGTQNTAELYNPASGTWSGTGTMVSKIEQATGTLLASGKVLVAGGFRYVSSTNRNYTAESELFNPATGTWSLTGSMPSAHAQYASGLLPNGKVIVVSGVSAWPSDTGNATATVYDPSSGTWAAAGTLPAARYRHAATVLPYGGKVLASGGLNPATLARLNTTALYDPVANTWSTGPTMSIERVYHGAILLPNSKVLLAGGETNAGRTSTADLYDLFSNTITATTSMSIPRSNFSVTVAGDPATTWPVLVAGGYTPPNNSTTATAETFNAMVAGPAINSEAVSMPPVLIDWTGTVPPIGTVSPSTPLSLVVGNTTTTTKNVQIDMIASGLDERSVVRSTIQTLVLAPGAAQTITVTPQQFPVQSIGTESQVALIARPYLPANGAPDGMSTGSSNLFYEFAAGYGSVILHASRGKDLDRTQPAQSTNQTQLLAALAPIFALTSNRQGQVWDNSTGGFVDVTTLTPPGYPDVAEGSSYIASGQIAKDTLVLKDGLTNNYNPPLGSPLRTLCVKWKAHFDDGESTDDYLHTNGAAAGNTTYEPARYADAIVFYGSSLVVWSGPLDDQGCVALVLGTGTFSIGWGATATKGGTTFSVKPGMLDYPAANPSSGPGQAGYLQVPDPPFSFVSLNFLTSAAVQLNVSDGFDTFVSRVAAVMATSLRTADFNGTTWVPFSAGLQAGGYSAFANDDSPCGNPINGSCGTQGSCGGVSGLNMGYVRNAATGLCYHQTLRKYVAGHELGHMVMGKLFGTIGADYDGPQQFTPDKQACRCDFVNASNRAHCLTSREMQGSAITEGLGHFFASKLMNNPTQTDCTFVYYKELYSAADAAADAPFEGGLPPGQAVSCNTPEKWMEGHCPSSGNPADVQLGVEWDWLTALYAIHTDPTYPYTMADIGDVFRYACSGNKATNCDFQGLRFNAAALPVKYFGSDASVPPGATSLLGAACHVVADQGNGFCNANDGKVTRLAALGLAHGIDH